MKCEFSRREFLTIAACAAGIAVTNGCSAGEQNTEAHSNAVVAVNATPNPDGTLRVPGGGKLAPGTALAFTLASEDESPGIVFLTRDKELRAFSAKCTHAACTVAWQRKNNTELLQCPCHGSQFDTAGQVLNGPAQLPLNRYEVRVEGDDAIITLPS